MVEIFGAAFALLLILFLFINLFVEAQLRALTENSVEESVYKIDWERGAAGYIVLAFPDRLQIIENKEISFTSDIKQSCAQTNFFKYAQQVYDKRYPANLCHCRWRSKHYEGIKRLPYEDVAAQANIYWLDSCK